MKIPNKEEAKELERWDLKADKTNVRVLVPKGKIDFYKKKEIPIDGSFTLKTSELDDVEWLALFKLSLNDSEGVLLSRVIEEVKEKMGSYYGIDDIVAAVKKDPDSEALAKQALANRFRVADSWGLFEKEGTKIKEIAKPGAITIIDV